MKTLTKPQELDLRIGDQVITLPVLDVSLWEDTDEEGFIGDEGYVYYTPYGKVITRITDRGEDLLHAQLDWETLGLPFCDQCGGKEL